MGTSKMLLKVTANIIMATKKEFLIKTLKIYLQSRVSFT